MEAERTEQAAKTSRQREVHRLVAGGYTNGEIAEALGISLSGVKWHVSELLMRYSVDSREELVEAWRKQTSPWKRVRMFAANAVPALSLKLAGIAAAGFAGVASLSLVVAAVSNQGTFSGLLDRGEREFPAAVTADYPPPPTVPMDPNLWNAAWEISSSSQRAMLLDGSVTFEDYESGILGAKACLDDHGIPGYAHLDSESQTYDLAASYNLSEIGGTEEARRIETDNCYSEHALGVSQAWGALYEEDAAIVAAARETIAECMTSQGLPEPPVTNPAAWGAYPLELRQAHYWCIETFREPLELSDRFMG